MPPIAAASSKGRVCPNPLRNEYRTKQQIMSDLLKDLSYASCAASADADPWMKEIVENDQKEMLQKRGTRATKAEKVVASSAVTATTDEGDASAEQEEEELSYAEIDRRLTAANPLRQALKVDASERSMVLMINHGTPEVRKERIVDQSVPTVPAFADGYQLSSRPTRGYDDALCDRTDPNRALIFTREHPLEGVTDEEKVAAARGRPMFPTNYTSSAIAQAQPRPPVSHWRGDAYHEGTAPAAGREWW